MSRLWCRFLYARDIFVAPLHPGLAAFLNCSGVTPAARGHAGEETPAYRKLRKAAQDFEGLLIAELWDQSSTDYSSLPGETQTAGPDTLKSLAIQTMSVALAQRGGLGIARMLVRQLEPSLNRGQAGGKIKTASSG
jgi:Rod binding domain-containing protein